MSRRGRRYTSLASLANWTCALACVIASGCQDRSTERDITNALAMIETPRLRQHVAALTDIGPRSSQQTAALQATLLYITEDLLDHGIRFALEPLPADKANPDGQGPNLIATFAGTDTDSETFEIGAHYDTVANTPGADDNASSIAALLEIARVLAATPHRRTIRLCFFAGEENGLTGSTQHVDNMNARRETLAGALILEMVGYTDHAPGSQRSPARIPLLFWPPDTANFIAVVGNFRSGSIGNRFEAAAARYVPELRVFSANRVGGLFRDALRSDHKPYWESQRKAVMLTDTANFRNPHYHQPSDTADTLDYAFLTAVTRATLATVLRWSGPPSRATRAR